jgi:hypothetical protein
MFRTMIGILISHRHKPIDSINLFDLQRRRNVFPVRYGQAYRFELSFEKKTGRWIMSRRLQRGASYQDILTDSQW